MTKSDILRHLATIMHDYPGTSLYIENNLIAPIEEDIRMEESSRKGCLNASKTISAMLKNMEGFNEAIRYPWVDSQNRQCVCDGFRAFRLKNHLPLIERSKNAPKPLDLDKIYPVSLDGWKKLPLPSIDELKAHIAIEKARWTGKRNMCPHEWDFGPNEPTVNSLFLLDLIKVFPDATELFWLNMVRPLVCVTPNGDALILPIRDSKKAISQPQSDAERDALEREVERERRNAKEALRRGELKEEYRIASLNTTDAKNKYSAALAIVRDAEKNGSSDLDELRNNAAKLGKEFAILYFKAKSLALKGRQDGIESFTSDDIDVPIGIFMDMVELINAA